MRNFVQVFRWRAVKSGTDDDSFKTRYKRSGNGLSTIIVDPLKHLLDACSRVSRERERDVFYSHLLTADISISACKLLSRFFNRTREGDSPGDQAWARMLQGFVVIVFFFIIET